VHPRVTFDVATPRTLPGHGYDLICLFDALHDVATRSAPPGLGLGTQAGERQLANLLGEAGFSHVRRATETPFNIILEARP
jgi:hypothetical protein